jgi:hypothetical protein
MHITNINNKNISNNNNIKIIINNNNKILQIIIYVFNYYMMYIKLHINIISNIFN